MYSKAFKSSVFIIILLVALYGILSYLGGINLDPVRPDEPVRFIRFGRVVMDLPRSMEVRRFETTLKTSSGEIYLTESINDPPPAYMNAAGLPPAQPKSGDEEEAPFRFAVDVSADLGLPATFEIRVRPDGMDGQGSAAVALQVVIRQPSGYLGLTKRFTVAREDLHPDKMEKIIEENQAPFLAQVRDFLPFYQWLGPEGPEKADGFMTRQGVILPRPGAPEASLAAVFRHKGDLHISEFSLSVGSPPATWPDPDPPFGVRMSMLMDIFSSRPSKSHIEPYSLAGRDGLEKALLTYTRRDSNHTFFLLEWIDGPVAADQTWIKIGLVADGFDQTDAPKIFGLWRSIIDSAR